MTISNYNDEMIFQITHWTATAVYCTSPLGCPITGQCAWPARRPCARRHRRWRTACCRICPFLNWYAVARITYHRQKVHCHRSNRILARKYHCVPTSSTVTASASVGQLWHRSFPITAMPWSSTKTSVTTKFYWTRSQSSVIRHSYPTPKV